MFARVVTKIIAFAKCAESAKYVNMCGYWNPEDEYPVCSLCYEKLKKELEAELRADVECFVVKAMPSYLSICSATTKETLITATMEDVMATSRFESEHCYNKTDISIAFQRVFTTMCVLKKL